MSVIIPSRTCELQAHFLTRAIESIRGQTQPSILKQPIAKIEIIVVRDLGSRGEIPVVESDIHVRLIHSTGQSQAAALNAGVADCDGHYIAFLEDDDIWHPERLAITLPFLDACDFCSSNQLEIDLTTGNTIRVNDFPTPSGWIMPRATWDAVGPFNESFRFHLDNEWLGRLAQKTQLRRLHLVESTAPTRVEDTYQVRPWLANVIQQGGPHSHLIRHRLPVPLITRTVHTGSGMDRIASDIKCAVESQKENQLLLRRFHRIPW